MCPVSCSATDKCFICLFAVNVCTNCAIEKFPQQDADDHDEELDPEESLGKTNSVLKTLMQKVGQECWIPNVIINHRL